MAAPVASSEVRDTAGAVASPAVAPADLAATARMLRSRSVVTMLITVPAVPAVVLPLAAYLRPSVDVARLATWTTTVVAVSVVLFGCAAATHRGRSRDRRLTEMLHRIAIPALIGLLGLCFGVAGASMPTAPGSDQPAMVIQLFVAGTAASAVIAFGPSARNFLCFQLPALLGNAAWVLAAADSRVPRFISAVDIAFLVVLGAAHRIVVESSRDAIVGRLHAERLARSLQVERDRVAASNAALSHQIAHDALTGIANRVRFFEALSDALRFARRRGDLVAVLFIDLDCFKTLNDTRGHAAGDAVLAVTGTRLAREIREVDIAARHGGDEFTVLLRSTTTRADALFVAERILERLRLPIPTVTGEVRVTASIGLAFNEDLEVSPDRLVQLADAALYRAKQDGRDRVGVLEAAVWEEALARRSDAQQLTHGLETGEVSA